MRLSERAQAFEGKTIELTRSGIGVVAVDPEFRVVRRTAAGDRGTIVHVVDAGFNGLRFEIVLPTGEHINAYEADVRVVA